MPNPKRPDAVRDLRAIAIRVSPHASDVFDIARAAYGHRSLQDLLRPLLEAEAQRLSEIPQIREMLAAAQTLRAHEEAVVTPLDRRRRRR